MTKDLYFFSPRELVIRLLTPEHIQANTSNFGSSQVTLALIFTSLHLEGHCFTSFSLLTNTEKQ